MKTVGLRQNVRLVDGQVFIIPGKVVLRHLTVCRAQDSNVLTDDDVGRQVIHLDVGTFDKLQFGNGDQKLVVELSVRGHTSIHAFVVEARLEDDQRLISIGQSIFVDVRLNARVVEYPGTEANKN